MRTAGFLAAAAVAAGAGVTGAAGETRWSITLPAQGVPRVVSELAARAGLRVPVMSWCRGDFGPAGASPFAVAVGSPGAGRYFVLMHDGATVELAEFEGSPSLACYTPAEARKLDAAMSQSETIEGRITPRWSTTVACGFVDDTTAVCWQYSPVDGGFVKVGGWIT